MRKLKKHEIVAIILFGSIAVIFTVAAIWFGRNKDKDWLVFADSLDEIVAEVNGQNLTLRDMAFYIAYDEMKVEEQAEIYDPEDTSRYWNVATNGVFLRLLSKESVMDKAIHDEIFYRMAINENIDLTTEDEQEIADAQKLFWNSIMYGDKLQKLGVTEDDLNETIRKIGIAQKYQLIYAEEHNKAMEDYDIDAEDYEKLLSENQYYIYDNVWDRVQYGEITLEHKKGIYN